MSDNICKYCSYFVQHFRDTGKGFTEVGYGHCIQSSRVKSKRDTAYACDKFQKKEEAQVD